MSIPAELRLLDKPRSNSISGCQKDVLAQMAEERQRYLASRPDINQSNYGFSAGSYSTSIFNENIFSTSMNSDTLPSSLSTSICQSIPRRPYPPERRCALENLRVIPDMMIAIHPNHQARSASTKRHGPDSALLSNPRPAKRMKYGGARTCFSDPRELLKEDPKNGIILLQRDIQAFNEDDRYHNYMEGMDVWMDEECQQHKDAKDTSLMEIGSLQADMEELSHPGHK